MAQQTTAGRTSAPRNARSCFFELSHICGRKLAPAIPLLDFSCPLGLGGHRAIRAVIPTRLERAPAAGTSAAEPFAARWARKKVQSHRAAAPRAQRPHLAHLGH